MLGGGVVDSTHVLVDELLDGCGVLVAAGAPGSAGCSGVPVEELLRDSGALARASGREVDSSGRLVEAFPESCTARPVVAGGDVGTSTSSS